MMKINLKAVSALLVFTFFTPVTFAASWKVMAEVNDTAKGATEIGNLTSKVLIFDYLRDCDFKIKIYSAARGDIPGIMTLALPTEIKLEGEGGLGNARIRYKLESGDYQISILEGKVNDWQYKRSSDTTAQLLMRCDGYDGGY